MEVSAMAEAVKSRSRRRKSGEEEVERQQLMEGMELTRIQLNQAYAEFNAHSDPELVESCVFAINALRSRYSWYVRQFKQLEARKEAAG